MTATATRRSRAAVFLYSGGRGTDDKIYPTRPEGVSDAIADDIAERRSRPTGAETNSRAEIQRKWAAPVQRPTGPSVYEMLYKPHGLSAACATCMRHVEAGANCPGRDPTRDDELRGILPDCHSEHDADRAAVQAAMEANERKE